MDTSRASANILEVEGSFNVRDLGGYPTQNGLLIKSGRFLRAGALHSLTAAGRQTLLDTGVNCIIDLRSGMERETKPDTLEKDDAFAWYHVPMLDYINSSVASGRLEDFPASMAEMYIGLLDNAGNSFARIFELFADPRYSGFLFHCTAGKDRTGMTAMLLLSLAGVPEEIIVEDYSLSERLVPQVSTPGNFQVPAYFLTSHPDTMREALRHLKNRYGTADDYLSHIGVTPGQRAAVLAKLLND